MTSTDTPNYTDFSTPDYGSDAAYNRATHSPDYRPSNVEIVPAIDPMEYRGTGYAVLDWDGAPIGWFKSYQDAYAKQTRRRSVIKAANTRRRNKALAIR